MRQASGSPAEVVAEPAEEAAHQTAPFNEITLLTHVQPVYRLKQPSEMMCPNTSGFDPLLDPTLTVVPHTELAAVGSKR